MKGLRELGLYLMLMRRVFRKPEKRSIYFNQFLREIELLGIDSIGITIIMSIFIGAVIAIQTASNIDSPLIPMYLVGFTTRQTVVLEFSPTILSIILAGKVGSRIASEIGTMRVTEQIDALEIMGINSACYLILPKIIASLVINPILVVFSMFVGIAGGWLASIMTGLVSSYNFLYGIHYDFEAFSVTYALIKTVVFAFIISSVSAFYGYYAYGGSLQVGASSTKAVVNSTVLILLFNLVLTQLLLA